MQCIKAYQKIQARAEQLKATATMEFRGEQHSRAENVDRQSFFWLNLKIISLEWMLAAIKLLIILRHDSGTVFKVFYQTNDFEPCPFSYRSFKAIHKKTRVFSYSLMMVAVFAVVLNSFPSVRFMF